MAGRFPAVMFQGTGSNVGKSLLVAGLARAYTRRGLSVRPFKPQNMSNNAAVTPDGGEIGRAQALQARAAGLSPDIHMNPVLLKPQSDIGSQVIVQGKVFQNCKARDYHKLKPTLLPAILDSFTRQEAVSDLVLVEGAGSPAEVNLRKGDIANMGFAEAAHVPVILVADIDRGGVLASLVGTYQLLAASEKKLLKGYVINKFRGDMRLFEPALDIINNKTGMRAFGICPWFDLAYKLPAEDAVALEEIPRKSGEGLLRVIVPQIPRIANFDDLDPLMAEADVQVEFIKPGTALPQDGDLILLPGSKSTIADLQTLRDTGWDIDILSFHRQGGWILGICAGYQMLGHSVADPAGIEGPAIKVRGLGLLDVETVMAGDKSLIAQSATAWLDGENVSGYEMHMGKTDGPGRSKPMLQIGDRADGAVSPNGRVMGSYMHGLFASDGFRRAFLRQLRKGRQSDVTYEQRVEETLDHLADHVENYLNLDDILTVARGRAKTR